MAVDSIRLLNNNSTRSIMQGNIGKGQTRNDEGKPGITEIYTT